MRDFGPRLAARCSLDAFLEERVAAAIVSSFRQSSASSAADDTAEVPEHHLANRIVVEASGG